MELSLRSASVDDTDTLLAIYRPYVERSSATLEDDVPTREEFAERIRGTLAEFPYIVCEKDGKVVGYAYAHKYKQRIGYRFCAELSVYVAEDCRGAGVGRRLYGALIELLENMRYTNLYGIVTDPNPGSFALHAAFGFRETGREHLSGVKFGEWHDVVLFEKLIAPHEPLTDDPHRMPLTISDLGQDRFAEILAKYGE